MSMIKGLYVVINSTEGQITQVKDLEGMLQAVKQLNHATTLIVGLKPEITPKYVTITDGNGLCLMASIRDLSTESREIVLSILNSNACKVFAEGKTILKGLIKAGFSISLPYFDISLAGEILDSGEGKITGYADVIKRYMDVPKGIPSYVNWIYSLNTSHFIQVIREGRTLFSLVSKLESELKDAGLSEIARLEFKCLPSIVKMELEGVGFDTSRWKEAQDYVHNETEHSGEQLKQRFGIQDPNNDLEIIATLQNHGIHINNLTQETLSEISGQENMFVQMVSDYLACKRKKSLCSGKMLSFVDKENNRIYPEYSQIGSATGRIYASTPNIQQMPKHPKIRRCIVPKAGHVLIDGDYSQIDLRVGAEIANEEVMIDAFNRGVDLHRLTASFILNKPCDEVTPQERQAAKAVNFGLIFAMSSAGLKKKAKMEYGVDMTEEQASIFKEKFFQKYKGFQRWHEQMIKKFKLSTYSQVRKVGLRTILGRRRICSDNISFGQLFNFPIQGTTADILKIALLLLEQRLKPYEASVILVVHDEIVIEAPIKHSNICSDILRDTMVEAAQYLLKKVPVTVEVSVCHDWSERCSL